MDRHDKRHRHYLQAGRYGGTYAHKDIAFEFASWVSVEFKLYLIKEFQRLKDEELKQLGWDIRRNLAKINYRIHTDAIKENLVPPELSTRQTNLVYASEADVLNMALFGMTAKNWRRQESGRERQHSRRSRRIATRLPLQPGELERPVHPREPAAGPAAPQVESDRHSANETADRQRKRQAA